jgi:predicted YcjX-like family ATPase
LPNAANIAGFGDVMQRIPTSAVRTGEDLDLPGQDEKQAALRFILDAWEEAIYEGLDPDCIATAAIFAALSDMIATYGEEPVAVLCERLPERIRNGEFTVQRTKN